MEEGGRKERDRKDQEAVLTQTDMHEQGSAEIEQNYERVKIKRTALKLASRKGMTGVVEKMLAAGAKAELTDEVNGRLPMQCSDVRARHV